MWGQLDCVKMVLQINYFGQYLSSSLEEEYLWSGTCFSGMTERTALQTHLHSNCQYPPSHTQLCGSDSEFHADPSCCGLHWCSLDSLESEKGLQPMNVLWSFPTFSQWQRIPNKHQTQAKPPKQKLWSGLKLQSANKQFSNGKYTPTTVSKMCCRGRSLEGVQNLRLCLFRHYKPVHVLFRKSLLTFLKHF